MKITIDTQADSKEEIKKVIHLLSTFTKEDPRTNSNLFSNNQPSLKQKPAEKTVSSSDNAFADMFSTPKREETPSPSPPTESPENPIDFSAFTELVNQTEKKPSSTKTEETEKKPEITFF